MFRGRSLNFKLRLSFLFLIVFLIIIGGISLFSLNRVSNKYEHVSRVNLQNAISLGQMDSSSREILRRLLQFTLITNTDGDKKRIEEAITKNIEIFQNYKKTYENLPHVDGEEKLYRDVDSNWRMIEPLIDKATILAKSSIESDKVQFSELYRGSLKGPRDAYFLALSTLINFQKKQATLWTKDAESTADLYEEVTIITLFFAVILAVILAFTISNSLTSNLRSIVQTLEDSSNDVKIASTQIASASEELSNATTEQSASLQQTSTSIEEISLMIKTTTDNAKQSTILSAQSLDTAENGKAVVDRVTKAIEEISTSNTSIVNQINETNTEIEKIVQIINEIGTKTKIINEIVFQTKLLSFNASVEAARAGDHGKGFAVVAEEVGNLASMSGNAALEISNILDGSIKTVEGIVRDSKEKIGKLVTDSKEKIEAGTHITLECKEVLDNIVSQVESSSKMIAEISNASAEQAQGVQEITKAIQQIDQVTQQNTANSIESAAAANSLSNQADMLDSLVHGLVQTIEGKNKAGKYKKSSPQISEETTFINDSSQAHLA